MTVRAARRWDRLPQAVEGSCLLGTFDQRLGDHLSEMLCQLPALGRGFHHMASRSLPIFQYL